MKNLGSESNRNSRSLAPLISSRSGRLDGHLMDTQAHRDPTTAQLVPMSALDESSQTHITVPASQLESTFPVPMLRLCQASGSSRLDLAPVFPSEITFGWRAIFSPVSLRTTT